MMIKRNCDLEIVPAFGVIIEARMGLQLLHLEKFGSTSAKKLKEGGTLRKRTNLEESPYRGLLVIVE